MQAHFIAELTEGARVDAAFVLRTKEVRATRNGEAFLVVELADRSGHVPGVLFRPPRLASEVPVGSVVDVTGVVTTYRGVKRVSIERLRPASSWNAGDLMASGPRDSDELSREFAALVRTVTTPGMRRILKRVFGDGRFFARFALCPGSPAAHHAYSGGLIEHTVAVASHCARMANTYPGVDRDLLVTAALLHDIGRVDEITIDAGIGVSDRGRLLGHTALGIRRIHEAGAACKTGEELLALIEHAVASHHNKEGASGSAPMTIEALVLSHSDALDVDAATFMRALGGASMAQERWTDSANDFGRALYAPLLDSSGDQGGSAQSNRLSA